MWREVARSRLCPEVMLPSTKPARPQSRWRVSPICLHSSTSVTSEKQSVILLPNAPLHTLVVFMISPCIQLLYGLQNLFLGQPNLHQPLPIPLPGQAMDCCRGDWGPGPCPSICSDCYYARQIILRALLGLTRASGRNRAIFHDDPLRLSDIFSIGSGTSSSNQQGRR
jgi:hypothetical protein